MAKSMIVKKHEHDAGEVEFIHAEKAESVRSMMRSDDQFFRFAEKIKTLGDPTRLKILFALSQAELCVCDIANLLCVSKSLISHHLRLLKTMRLVRYRREGKMAFYVLDDEHIRNIFTEGFNHIEE